MQSSSTTNHGSLGSLLALSPQPSPAREPYSANQSSNFGNAFEHVRQEARQSARQPSRQDLASNEPARGPAVRENQPPPKAEAGRPPAADTHREQNDTSARATNTGPGKKHTDPAVPVVSEDISAEPVASGTALESVVGDVLPPNVEPTELAILAVEQPVIAEEPDTEVELALSAQAQAALITDSDLASALATNKDTAAVLDKNLAAVSGLPLMTQAQAKAASATITTEVMEGESDAAADGLLAKSLVGKSVAGESGSGTSSQANQGDMSSEANNKDLFTRLLAGQTESAALPRERVAANAATNLAAPALEAMSRAVESLTPAGRGFVVQSGVAVPMGQPQWSQAVGDRVLWLAAQNISSAELRLDPPELGPMQVRVSVQQEQVQVTFTSPHANVREALDQSATRLREMFNEQGLNLSLDVSDQPLSRREDGGEGNGRKGTGASDEPEEEVVAEVAIGNLRLVDHYA